MILGLRKFFVLITYFLFCFFSIAFASHFPNASLCRYALSGPPELAEWPQVKWDSLVSPQDITDEISGVGIMRAFVATYKNNKVFLKVSTVPVATGYSSYRSTAELKNEAFWFYILSQRGWSPRIYGISKFQKARESVFQQEYYALVTDYVEGEMLSSWRIKNHTQLPKFFAPTAQSLQKLKEFFVFLEEHDVYPHDLQLLVQEDGSWNAIDLEWYFHRSKLIPYHLKESEQYEENKQRILQYFEDRIVD